TAATVVAAHAVSRAVSAPARRPFFSAPPAPPLRTPPLQQQKAIRQQGHTHVVVQAPPRAPLEVVQAQLFLQLLIPLLHRPAALPQSDSLLAAGVRRQVRERILDLAIRLLFDQKPHRLRAGTFAPLPAVAGPDAKPGEAAAQLALGPLPPRDLAPGHAGGQ